MDDRMSNKLFTKEVGSCNDCPARHYNEVVKKAFCSISPDHFEIENTRTIPEKCPLENVVYREQTYWE